LLKDAFDMLWQEGAQRPKTMSVGLHARISGHPARAPVLARFLDYVQKHDSVWMPAGGNCQALDGRTPFLGAHRLTVSGWRRQPLMLYKRAANAGAGGSGCYVERPGRPAGRMQSERKPVDHHTEVIE